jgi:hypothetical protein
MSGPLLIRRAEVRDVGAVTRLVNLAYEVERFFVRGDRIAEVDVAARMASGAFLVGERADGHLVASVYTELRPMVAATSVCLPSTLPARAPAWDV